MIKLGGHEGTGIGSIDSVKDEYSELAATYDERWAFYVKASIRETLKRLDLAATNRVLDVGCGSGALLRALRNHYPHAGLAGANLSTEMLAIARKKLPPSVGLLAARAGNLPVRTGAFDLVVSTSAFHYWRDPIECLGEIRRALKPGGKLVISDWCHDYLACRVCDLYLRVFSPSHFRTYTRDDCARLLEEAGFQEVQVDRYKISWLWGMMTAQATGPAWPSGLPVDRSSS